MENWPTNPEVLFDNLIGTYLPMKQWDKAYDAVAWIIEHLIRGGQPPRVPPKTYISLGNGGPVSYSILSLPKSNGAVFIRYAFSQLTGMMEETHKYTAPGR